MDSFCVAFFSLSFRLFRLTLTRPKGKKKEKKRKKRKGEGERERISISTPTNTLTIQHYSIGKGQQRRETIEQRIRIQQNDPMVLLNSRQVGFCLMLGWRDLSGESCRVRIQPIPINQPQQTHTCVIHISPSLYWYHHRLHTVIRWVATRFLWRPSWLTDGI